MALKFKVAAALLAWVAACFSPSSCASTDNSTTTDLLWPLPTTYAFGSGYYTLNPSTFKFVPVNNGVRSDTLQAAIERYTKLIFDTPVPFYPSGGNGSSLGELLGVYVDVEIADETLGPATNETYDIIVMDGQAIISALNVYGALRGLETFSQLVYRRSDGSYAMTEAAIIDVPRFTYRGTMIDTARHYLTLETILTHLDAMSYGKLNVLHWHMTDSQSFPYESEVLPQLSSKGAYVRTHVYSQQMIKEVIEQARLRGIRVIVEFDTPGHSLSWGAGEPKMLTQCYNSSRQPDGFGPLNPVSEYMWDTLCLLYSEVIALFPDPYVHIGGDEVSYSCWESNPEIQQWMKERNYTDYSLLQAYYENRLIGNVAAANRTPIVWQEVFDNGVKVQPPTLVDIWKSGWQKEMKRVTGSGLSAVLSACWYLNRISFGEDWIKYYQCDPQNFNGTAVEQSLVMGGHAALWAEYVDSTNFLTRYWPRVAAVAERLWSRASVNDTDAAMPRLHNFRCRMISRGIPAEPVEGPSFCTTEWRGY